MTPSALTLVYLLPLAIALGLCAFLWRKRSHSTTSGILTTIGIGVAWVSGFYGLLGLWPWQTWPIRSAIHWLPVGILVSVSVSWLLDNDGDSMRKHWVLLALLSMGTLFAWLMLRPFLFKVNIDWSMTQHLLLALALMLGAWIHHLGVSGLARQLPASAFLCAVGTLVLGAMLYSFQGASSAKVAQLLSVGGLLAGSLALLAFWLRPGMLGASQGWLWSSLITLPMLYAVYSADEPHLWPLIPLLVAPIAGLPGAFRSSVTQVRRGALLGFVGSVVLLTGIGIAVTFLKETPEGDDDLDAYALLPVVSSPELAALRVAGRRPATEVNSVL